MNPSRCGLHRGTFRPENVTRHKILGFIVKHETMQITYSQNNTSNCLCKNTSRYKKRKKRLIRNYKKKKKNVFSLQTCARVYLIKNVYGQNVKISIAIYNNR